MDTEKSSSPVVLGRISGFFGVRGWLKIYSYTETLTNILDYPEWQLDGETFKLETGKAHGKGIIAKLSKVENREQAATLIGREITVPREQLPNTANDEYYWSDLEGMKIITTQGDSLGTIDHLFATGANDVMVIKGERERLLPFISDVVLEIKPNERLILVDWDKDF